MNSFDPILAMQLAPVNILRAVIAMATVIGFALPALGQLTSGSCGEYRGTLDDSTEIGMSIYSRDKTLQGSYFYKKHLADIPLQGSYDAPRDISLTETNSDGSPRGTFHLHFAEHDLRYSTDQVLQGEVLQGKWLSADGHKTHAVSLRMQSDCPGPGTSRYAVAGSTSDTLVEKNASAFYDAVLSGNRQEAVKYVSFPCAYFENGKRISIKDPGSFLKDYNRIFSPAFVAKIAKDVPHHMFANWQGVMIADGALWFDERGKAKNFNNQN